MGFEKGRVYENVYLVFVDALGHSNVVKQNPKDVSVQGFDSLFEKIISRLNFVSQRKRCSTAVVWSWLGDGGMIAIYDEKESVSVDTTISFVYDFIKLDLPILQSEFVNAEISGELHIRVAVHKGTIKYTEEGHQGFIHSSDINWGAHLERATPRDSISISKDIYDVLANKYKQNFHSVGSFEGRETYMCSPYADEKQISLRWRALQGFSGMELAQCYLERISQKDKAELIDSAKETVIDFGTTLNTCSNYLLSTERPVPYRDAVFRLLDRGGYFICYMLSPNSSGSKQLIMLQKENIDKKLETTMTRFTTFKQKNPQLTVNFKVFQFDENPNLAAMVIDPKSEDSVCLYSPYLNVKPDGGLRSGRADMPHYLVCKSKHQMFSYIWEYISSYIQTAKEFP